MLLWEGEDRLLLLTGTVKIQTCFSPLSPFICAQCLGAFGCLWTTHKMCCRWLHCIRYFCQCLRGDLTVLAKFSVQDRTEEAALQSSGFKIRPPSPIALYCLGSLSQLYLLYHQPEVLQHPASHKQERERRWTSHQAPGQGKEQQPNHLSMMLILSCTVKGIAMSRSKSYTLLSWAAPRAKYSWRKNQKPSNPVNLDPKQSEQC